MRSLLIKAFIILLAASANLALGFYWYGSEFNKQWSSAAHQTADFKHPTHEQLAVAVIGSVLTAFVLSMIGHRLAGKGAGFFKRESVVLIVAAIAWLGFAVATAAKHYAFLGHSQNLLAFDYAYDLAGMLVMGIIVGLVR